MAVTWSVAEGRAPEAEKGSECQQASVWLPGEGLIQKAGAEWAAGGCAKLAQAGVPEKDAGFISFLIKKSSQLPKPWLLALTLPAGPGAGISEAGWVGAE